MRVAATHSRTIAPPAHTKKSSANVPCSVPASAASNPIDHDAKAMPSNTNPRPEIAPTTIRVVTVARITGRSRVRMAHTIRIGTVAVAAAYSSGMASAASAGTRAINTVVAASDTKKAAALSHSAVP
jgi:hypothetical protein